MGGGGDLFIINRQDAYSIESKSICLLLDRNSKHHLPDSASHIKEYLSV